jgi:ubiquinone/menaquinone biosynthesis C-methylase UbiE
MEKIEYAIMYDIEQSYWWFLGKQFLVRSVLQEGSLCDPEKDRILDIGCGTGTVLKLLEDFGTACGVELSTDAIQFLKKRGLNLVVRSDVSRSIPFKDNVFSVITCLDVLEHLDDDFALLKEMVRVCRPGGHIVVTVPALNVLWSPHDTALHHKRRYTRKQLLQKVAPLPASVVKRSYYNTTLIIPILAVRKIKPLFSDKQSVRSDFFMPIPRWINAFLTFLFFTEIRCLKRLNFPLGVSLLLIMKKSSDHAASSIQDGHE